MGHTCKTLYCNAVLPPLKIMDPVSNKKILSFRNNGDDFIWQGVRMPMLTELKLQSCEGINSSSMVALSHCLMLEV